MQIFLCRTLTHGKAYEQCWGGIYNLSTGQSQWRGKGGGDTCGHAPRSVGFGGASSDFLQSFKNGIEAEMLIKICLKMRTFWKKTVKIAAASGTPPSNLRLTSPGVVTPAYYLQLAAIKLCSFVGNAFYCNSKKRTTTVNILLLLLRTFASIFHFKFCNFCWLGCKNISCPQALGALATPLGNSAYKEINRNTLRYTSISIKTRNSNLLKI